MILTGFDNFTNDISLYGYNELKNDIELKNKYLSWLNDDDIVSPIMSPELMKDKDISFIESSFNRFTKEDCKGFFIKYETTKIFVGTIKLDKINYINKSCELGIMIGDKSIWGKKIGEKSCKILIKYAFEDLNLNRIWGGSDEHNIAMQKLFLKCGFQQEGRFRQINFFEGKYSDNIHYSILRNDYNEIKDQKNG